MRKRYTASAEKVLENAGKEAVSRGMSYVGTEHLLLALIKTKGVAAEVLRENAVNAESLEEMIQEMDKSAAGVLTKEKGDFTPRVRKVIEQSVQEAIDIARRGGAQICFPDARIHGGACLFDSIGHNQLPSIL